MISKSVRSKAYLNENFLGPDGLIHNNYIGDQTGVTVKQTEQELQHLTQKVRAKNKPVLIIVDISKIDKIQLSARHAGHHLIRNLDFDKAAIYGNHVRFKGIVEAVILASGCVFKVKLFESEVQARLWLTQDIN